MKVVAVLVAVACFSVSVEASNVICGAKTTSKSVTVEDGNTFSFKTQKGRKYKGNTECTVDYKMGDTCAKMSFVCTKFNTNNKDKRRCSKGDKVTVTANGKSKAYCKTKKPKVVSTGDMSVVFTSDTKKHGTGAVCKVKCTEAAGGGTGPYVPGGPGAKWTEEQAEIIQEKLYRLWKTSWNIQKDFDFQNEDAAETDYVYDPHRRLSTLDCEIRGDDMCSQSWTSGKRENNMAFKEPKAIRLAFHDCMPYTDGTGGCDGCLNFKKNDDTNNMLRTSIAILEKLYLEADFPEGATVLEASPKELGMSRADLWSFAGLVALDKVQETSKDLCSTMAYNLTCNDWDSPCFTKFPLKAKQLFKTGRSDCNPSSEATSKQGYLAAKEEADPDQNGNGPMTAKYFKDNFNLNPKEALALMGAHTIGGYSTFQTHIDYAWVRDRDSRRNEVFNNEYFKTLVAKPAHVKDKHCVGTMDGGKAKHEWHIFARLFDYYWPQDEFEAWNEKPRRLLWHHEVTRAPVCGEEDEDKLGQGDIFWNNKTLDAKVKEEGHASFWEYCCKQKSEGCGAEGTCDSECTRTVQNRIRFLSSDVGLYLKWEYDDKGYPTTEFCEAFKTKRAGWEWLWGKWLINGGEIRGPAGCPKQNLDDGYGQPLWKAVELYADNQPKWMNDFVVAWEKMSSNGYKAGDLVQGPKQWWNHL